MNVVVTSPQTPSPPVLMNPAEVVFAAFDSTIWLPPGASLVSAVVTVSNPANPADPIAAAMPSGVATIAGNKAIQKLSNGGPLGTQYLMTCAFTFSDTQKYDLSVNLLMAILYGVVS